MSGSGSPAATRPRWRRDVSVFLGAQTASMFGSMLVQYAVIWHLTLETKSGLVLMASVVFGMLPQAVVSIFGGVWADRLNRKWLIIASDSVIAVTTVVLATLLLSGFEELWLFYLVLAIRSTGAGIHEPAVAAIVPQLTPPEQLLRINGIYQGINSALMLVAPPVAGALIFSGASIVPVFWVDLASALVGIGLLLLISVPTVRGVVDTGYFSDLAAGIRYTFAHGFVRWLLVLFAIVFVLIVAPSTLTTLMLVRSFGEEVWMLTVNELALSVGMLAGSVVISIWGGIRNKVVLMLVASVLFGVVTAAMGLSSNIWVFFSFMLLIGVVVPFFATSATTLLQQQVGFVYQGRVFGVLSLVMAAAPPLGMLVFGPLSDAVPVESVLVGAGIACFVVVAIAALIPAGRRAIAMGAQPVVVGAQPEN